MSNLVLSKFVKGVRWNFVEAATYRILLLIYNVLLFNIVDKELYGLVGTIFSSIYLSITIANLGLDQSIGALFNVSTQSKSRFSNMFAKHVYANSIIITSMCIIFIAVSRLGYLHPAVTPSLSIIIAAIVISEAIKRTTRSVLQYAFLNYITATVEIIRLAAYATLLWGYQLLGQPVHINYIMMLFLCISAISTCVLLIYACEWYHRLPDQDTYPKNPSQKHIIHNRALNTCNTIGKNMYTHNCMIILFAYKYGMQEAATIKVIGVAAKTITSLASRTYSRVSTALLSHTKNADLKEKQIIFSFLTNTLYQGMYFSALVLLINYHHISSVTPILNQNATADTFIILILIALCEHLFFAYEQWYIVEEHITIFIPLHSLSSIALLTLLSAPISTFTFMTGILAIRIAGFTTIHYITWRRWKLSPNWSIQPTTVYAALITTICISLLRR